MAPGIHVPRIEPPYNIGTETSKTAKVQVAAVPLTPTEEKNTINQDEASNPAQHQGILLLHPSFVTTDFDELRFNAAAFSQLTQPIHPEDNHTSTSTSPQHHHHNNNNQPIHSPSSPIYSTSLISSPYNHPGHYLSLPSLPPSSRLFALALTALRPIVPDYATAPYASSLNFPAVLQVLRALCARENITWHTSSFYVVIFRSQLKPGIDNDWLYKLDYESHGEACESGGLLKYWFGKAGGERRNLATCFWHSREDAHKGGLGPWHKKARAAGRELYERIVFSAHRFTVLDGAKEFVFEDWKE